MKYASIRSMDISNGEGIGAALFVQGCHFHCKDCFNAETWDFNGGKEFTDKTLKTIKNLLNRSYIKRFTVLGGEPLCDENVYTVKNLILEVKKAFPDKKIWLYTGYTVDEIVISSIRKEVISLVDVLVEGRFEKELADMSYLWAGSTNQRVIRNPKETLKL